MRESDIEKYLCKQVKALDGEVRKVKWIGRANAPDRLVLIPESTPYLVELKRPGEKARPAQIREHKRLRRCGMQVAVLSTIEDVDGFLWPYHGGYSDDKS